MVNSLTIPLNLGLEIVSTSDLQILMKSERQNTVKIKSIEVCTRIKSIKV